jgi:uncharacterized Zn-finger protein
MQPPAGVGQSSSMLTATRRQMLSDPGVDGLRRLNAETVAALPPGLTTLRMANEIIPHFHNDLGVPAIEIGAKKFMCVGALPPQDHPHVFCDMGDDNEYVCPYCSTFFRHNPALAPHEARPAECELHNV